MNKQAKITLFIAIFVVAILFVVKARAAPKQCNDNLDNDGDSLIDYPNDPGCSSRQDNDETDPDSCTDSDGGINKYLAGNVSGTQSGQSYTFSDSCSNSTILHERYCSGVSPASAFVQCNPTNETCVDGRCIFI